MIQFIYQNKKYGMVILKCGQFKSLNLIKQTAKDH